jgi:hypothetical protein
MLMMWTGTCYKENTEAFVVASKRIGLGVSAEKTKYSVMSRNQNAGQNHNIKTDKKSFERVEQFKYLGKTVKNQNSIQEGINSRLKSVNACCYSVQNLLSSCSLSKNIRSKIPRTIILPVLCGCETWFLMLREEHRLRMFENRVVRSIFGPKRGEVSNRQVEKTT